MRKYRLRRRRRKERMTAKTVKMQIPAGLEARPVAMLVQVANQFASSIYLESESRRVNAKSIMGLMTLGLHAGEDVTIQADGEDETGAVSRIEEYLTGEGVLS